MQPINYGGMLGSSLASGIQSGLGMGQARQRANLINEEKQAMQLAQDQQKANAAKMVELYRSGTPDQVAEFSIANPESGKLLMGAISDRTGINQGEIMKVSEGILTNPKGTEAALTDRIQMIQGRGGDPSDTVRMLQEYRENPSQFMQQNEMFYAMNNPDKYKKYKEVTGQSQAEPMTAYQQEMVRQKDYEMDLRKLEIEEKRLERQLKRETDTLKKEELQQKIDENKKKSDEAKKTKESDALSAYQSGQDTLELVNRIKGHEGLKDFVGAKGASSLFGLKDTPIAGTQAAAVSGLIDTLSSQNFLNAVKQMQGMGALSDSEGKKLSSAVTSLDPNMPEKEFLENLNTVETLTERAMNKAKSKMPKEEVKAEEVQTQKYNVGQTARNPQTGEVLVFTESGWIKQ
ncbi:MAG: hypothetical protein GY886_09815 [Gammaproteobacteria bacterium]|nr:hypothetical protein [Gammaproteobacteria bacterium]